MMHQFQNLFQSRQVFVFHVQNKILLLILHFLMIFLQFLKYVS